MRNFKNPWYTLFIVGLTLFMSSIFFTKGLPEKLTLAMFLLGSLFVACSALGALVSFGLRLRGAAKAGGMAHAFKDVMSSRAGPPSAVALGAAAYSGTDFMERARADDEARMAEASRRFNGAPLSNIDGTPMANESVDVNGNVYGYTDNSFSDMGGMDMGMGSGSFDSFGNNT